MRMMPTHERRPVVNEAAPGIPATGTDSYATSLPAPAGPLLAVVVTRELANAEQTLGGETA